MKFFTKLLLTALLLSAGSAAHAEDCPGLRILGQVALVPSDDGAAVIPVILDGKPKNLLLDTGGEVSSLSPTTVAELGLKTFQANTEIIDVVGSRSDRAVSTTLELGLMKSNHFQFMVAPTAFPFGSSGIAGIIAPDVLRNYDVDVDFGAHKLNLFDPKHCAGKIPYWKADAVAVLPMQLMAGGNIRLTMRLDGQPVVAILDTGSSITSLYVDAAQRRFGLKLGSDDTPKIGDWPNSNQGSYRHQFKSLAFEGVQVLNPLVDIIPDLQRGITKSNARPELGSLIVRTENDETQQVMLLGMNVLRHLHLYIAYHEHKVYITATEDPTDAQVHSVSTAQTPEQSAQQP
jgi:predicted aspartyl protease